MGPLAPNPEFWVVTSWLRENPSVYPDRHLEDRRPYMVGELEKGVGLKKVLHSPTFSVQHWSPMP